LGRSTSTARSRSGRTSNLQVVNELDKASEPWGIKVLRYEIKNITPPKDVLAAMEKQMRAEREKRAVILTSEGERDAAINTAEGEKQQVIKASEAKKQQQINEAEGAAEAILAIAGATSEGIRKVAETIQKPGGYEAVQLRVAEQYIVQFGELAKATNTVVLPANVADVGAMIQLAMSMIKK
jgi:regulator of protease activity HflC (stomatin/prohibitin superfamily)